MRLSIHCARLRDEAVSKRFIKEVIAKATVFCTPIVPLAFLDPGRTRRMPDDHIAAARFRQERSISKADEEDIRR
jgi:hypothetical protein